MQLSEADKKRMLASANQVMKREEVQFNTQLPKHLADLLKAIKAKDFEAIELQSYHLKSTAGRFGWPLVGQAAGFLHLAMEKQKGSAEFMKAAEQLCDKLQRQVATKDNAETSESIGFLKIMYAELDRQGTLE